jgi:YgiT-type zinc finger domain-containing protein
MRCQRCDQGGRQPVRRAKLAERDGRVAVVLEVSMQECPACGERWLDWEVARRLDVMLNAMLAETSRWRPGPTTKPTFRQLELRRQADVGGATDGRSRWSAVEHLRAALHLARARDSRDTRNPQHRPTAD